MSVPTAAPGRLISPQEILREPAGRGAAVPAPAAAGRSAYIETYGCQMNVADTELVAAILGDAGYLVCERPEQADVILINTCAVREHAEERVIGRASQLSGLRAQRAKPYPRNPRMHGPTPLQEPPPAGPRSSTWSSVRIPTSAFPRFSPRPPRKHCSTCA